MVNRTIDVATSFLVSVARLGSGMTATAPRKQPAQRLELYEFEGCPFCRKVREALSELDLEASIYPCPKGGTRFRPVMLALGGKAQFPYLVDPNKGTRLYESNDIVAYLFETYGGRKPSLLTHGLLADAGSMLASAFRPTSGIHVRPSRAPAKPLELYSFESSPFCRIVRETLCELEIPYVLHNVASKSSRRAAFIERSGRMMVPYLVDPNSGKSLFESADIKAYLLATYGT